MSTREDSSVVSNKRIPKGYKITYHELRGYDSPDKWYEARCRNRKLGTFGTFSEALEACTKRANLRPTHVGSIKTKYKSKLRIWKSREHVTLYFRNQAIPLSYDAAEQLKKLL